MKRVGMVRVGLYLSDSQMKKLKTNSKKKGLTVSEIIRRMIDEGFERSRESNGPGVLNLLPAKGATMKCEECQKKIIFDHYLGSTGSNGGNIQLVFRCNCGFYIVPFDLVRISKGKGLISAWKDDSLEDQRRRNLGWEKDSHRKASEFLSSRANKLTDRWTKEVFLPLMDARLKKRRTHSVK